MTSNPWVTVVAAAVGAIAGIFTTTLAQVATWRKHRRRLDVGTARIVALMRQMRFFCDRGANEIRFQGSLRFYRDPWDGDLKALRSLLDAGENTLTADQTDAAYTAVFRCAEVILCSDHSFEQTDLEPRCKLATKYVSDCQALLGDRKPTAHFTSDRPSVAQP